MNTLIHQAKSSLQKYKRHAYFPIIASDNDDGCLTDSKFGGLPYMFQNEIWPFCKCGSPMELGIQLNLDTLPTKQFGNGLFQFWSCSQNDCLSTEVITRIIIPNGPETQVIMLNFSDKNFTPKRIIEWVRQDDYPHLDEIEEDALNEDIWEQLEDTGLWECPENLDKIGGWTSWC